MFTLIVLCIVCMHILHFVRFSATVIIRPIINQPWLSKHLLEADGSLVTLYFNYIMPVQ